MQGEDPAGRGGHEGGKASLHTSNVSAARFARYLKGISFPVNRETIVSTAKSNGAPENVMELFNRLPQREYNRANEVEQEFSKLK